MKVRTYLKQRRWENVQKSTFSRSYVPSRNKSVIRVLDLCAGIGGFRAGCSLVRNPNLVFKFVGFAEYDKYPKRAYKYAYKTTGETEISDIKELTRTENDEFDGGFLKKSSERSLKIANGFPDHDILFAGFPCQPFSIMGQEAGVDDMLGRGELIFDLVEIIREKQPNFFVLENVKKFVRHNEGRLCELVVAELRSIGVGYNVEVRILNAKDHGVPQTRNRAFIIGVKKNLDRNQISNTRKSFRSEYFSTVHPFLEKNTNSKYYLSEKIKPTILSSGTGGWSAKAEINKLVARPLTKTMHKLHRASQDNYYSDDFIHGTWDASEKAILTSNQGQNRIRRVTPYEALRIQAFPEDVIRRLLRSGLSDTRIYMAAGNAVPPPLVAAVLDSIPLNSRT